MIKVKLNGKIMKGTTIIKEEEVVLSGQGRFHKQLEDSLIELCKIWQSLYQCGLEKTPESFPASDGQRLIQINLLNL